MVPRGKVTGGSSAINGVLLLRGVPEDYDSWAEAGNDEWNFQKLLPYFRKMESDQDFHDDFHGTEGPIIAHRFKREEWLPSQAAFYNACRPWVSQTVRTKTIRIPQAWGLPHGTAPTESALARPWVTSTRPGTGLTSPSGKIAPFTAYYSTANGPPEWKWKAVVKCLRWKRARSFSAPGP